MKSVSSQELSIDCLHKHLHPMFPAYSRFSRGASRYIFVAQTSIQEIKLQYMRHCFFIIDTLLYSSIRLIYQERWKRLKRAPVRRTAPCDCKSRCCLPIVKDSLPGPPLISPFSKVSSHVWIGSSWKALRKSITVLCRMASGIYLLYLEVSSGILNHLITLKLLRYPIAFMNIVQEEK